MTYEKAPTKQGPTNQDEGYMLPTLPGTKVCLNPESQNYERILESGIENEDDLYLVSLNGAKEGLNWVSSGQINLKSWRVTIKVIKKDKYQFSETVNYLDLLPIEGKSKTVVKYETNLGSLYTIAGEDEIKDKNIMEVLMKKNTEVYSCETFNNEWRAKTIQKLTNDWEKNGKTVVY